MSKHAPVHKQKLRKAYDHFHNSGHEAMREVKPKSFYPWGRKKGSDLIRSQAYRDNWEKIFAKTGTSEVDSGGAATEDEEAR